MAFKLAHKGTWLFEPDVDGGVTELGTFSSANVICHCELLPLPSNLSDFPGDSDALDACEALAINWQPCLQGVSRIGKPSGYRIH